ncbi:MAG: DUF6157 family protein [Bacteroidota bacterium]
MKTTNYINTFIEVAEDCPVTAGEVPPVKGDKKTVANLQFEMVHAQPYKYTSDEVFFTVHAIRKDLTHAELDAAREQFFSKGQPCFRASPLTKRYGWGVHSDADGRVALYGVGSDAYEAWVADAKVEKVKAMRSRRAK